MQFHGGFGSQVTAQHETIIIFHLPNPIRGGSALSLKSTKSSKMHLIQAVSVSFPNFGVKIPMIIL